MCCVALLPVNGPVAAQTLSRIKSQVRESGAAPSARPAADPEKDCRKDRKRRSRAGYSSYSSDCDDSDNIVGQLAGYAFLAAASTPFVVPRAALGDDGEPGYYPDYPYDARGQVGSIVYDDSLPGAHDSLLVLQADYGTDFDSLEHAHGRLFGDVSLRVGIDTEFYYRHEDVVTGDDELWMGDANFTYRFAQNQNWQFRAGLGVNWLTDRSESDAGINTTYTVEWFPEDPWMLAGAIDWGRVGDTSLFHYRGTVGLTHNGWGIFTGYDYLGIGGERIHAWINGVEYRF